jgi:hypothetical protein
VLFSRDPTAPSGYIEETIFSAVKDAHALVGDLAAMADPASLPLEAARRSLYVAESRWWSRSGVRPEEASAGLAYAADAETIAQAELEKVGLRRGAGGLVFGHEGEVKLVAENGADYPVTAELLLKGEGLQFPQGVVVQVELAPGGNEIVVRVGGTGTQHLDAQLVAGDSVLGEAEGDLRFVTLASVLPWTILAIAIVGGVILSLLYRRGKRLRRPA